MRHPVLRWAGILVGLIVATAVARGGAPSDAKGPRPVAVWPAGPLEVRVAFDRPVDPGVTKGMVGKVISFGETARQAQDSPRAPNEVRGSHQIAASRLSDGGRTLILFTDPHPREATYSVTLPGIRAPGATGSGASVDLSYALAGVEAVVDDGGEDAKPVWSGWWPDLDPDVARARLRGSAGHEKGFALLGRPGRLTLRTLVRLPVGEATLRIVAGGPIEATLAGEAAESVDGGRGGHRADFLLESTGEAAELSVTVRTGVGNAPPSLHATYFTKEHPTPRRLPSECQIVPWAPAPPPAAAAQANAVPDLAGGDPMRGEVVFKGDQAKCANCHMVRGQGGVVGPDLSDLFKSDPASVYRDIAEPSATIHPEYVSYTVALKDGRVAVGVVRAEGADAIKVSDTEAKTTVVPRAQIEELRPSATSIMPVGLVGAIGEAGMRDLVAFLTTPPASAPASRKP